VKIFSYDISPVVGGTMARTFHVKGMPVEFRMVEDGDTILLLVETVEDDEIRPLHVICLLNNIEYHRDERDRWLGSVIRHGNPVHVQVRTPELFKGKAS